MEGHLSNFNNYITRKTSRTEPMVITAMKMTDYITVNVTKFKRKGKL